jgi:phage anti-repressor protein
MVENLFGYKKGKDMMVVFIRNLKKEFEENIDYKIVDKSHTLIKKFYSTLKSNEKMPGNRAKYYIITGETFKLLLMMSKTIKGKETRKFYLKVETLGITTTNIMTQCFNIMSNKQIKELKNNLLIKSKEIEDKTKEIEQSKNKLIKLNEFVKVAQELKKDEIFYVATTDLYAKNNRFEYGGVANPNDLPGRLATYNTGRAEGDLYYYVKIIKVHKYKHIENCLDMLIKGFKDKAFSKKEMVHMRYDCFAELIEFIIENHGKDIDFINEHGKRFLKNTIELEPILPEPIELGDYIIIRRKKNGKEHELQKIDVSSWDETKVQDLIKNLINQYAVIKLGTTYDFDTQKDSQTLQIIWKDFQDYLENYKGKKKMDWRTALKSITSNAKQLAIKWKA